MPEPTTPMPQPDRGALVERLLEASPQDYWDKIVREVRQAGASIRHAVLLNHEAAHLLAWAEIARNAATTPAAPLMEQLVPDDPHSFVPVEPTTPAALPEGEGADAVRVALRGAYDTLGEQRRRCIRWGKPHNEIDYAMEAAQEALSRSAPGGEERPIPMLLFCPRCHAQHVDEADPDGETSVEMSGRETRWDNPPHRSHLCHNCGCIWRPADVSTEGVASIGTVGKADNWTPSAPLPDPEAAGREALP